MNNPRTIRALLAAGSDDDPAICEPGRSPLSFGLLRDLIDRTGEALGELGIGHGDRVAIVLPNAPELAASFVAISCHATSAPLNPAYKQEEFEYYLCDLKATALVVQRGADSPAIAAARRLGIQILELSAEDGQPAGAFGLAAAAADGAEAGITAGGRAGRARAESRDIALMLHTSGTTSRPKLVPLSHANVCASARNIAKTLRLDRTDVCLNIMPLFHIHGLMAALLAPLGAGGAVFAAPGFDALRFFGWLEAAHPTWYTAVPTMHQAILRRATRNRAAIESARLRLIRSSSSPLPRQAFRELEETFGVPVIEAYAMTEAAHQMTSNPLPPGQRIAGTVGRAAGPEVAIMDETSNRLLGVNKPGEVVVRGESVISGYENNPEANAGAFAGGWFRTGDQAVMDDGGYLTITGRLKEIINRGGEKISPGEIDDVLMDHPAVGQAVTFAMPHPTLGEEVAAAVVLREGAECAEDDLRGFASARLAAFKVPRRVVLVDEIPKGASGKLQRIGLAAKLGLA